MVLEPSMILPGKDCRPKATPEQVAAATVNVLECVVPAAVPGICFPSGGQRLEEATANLNPMNVQFPLVARCRIPPSQAWAARMDNRPAAQQAFCLRAKMNGFAHNGRWNAALGTSA